MAGSNGNGRRFVRRVAVRQQAVKEDAWVRATISVWTDSKTSAASAARQVVGGLTKETLDRLCSLHVLSRQRRKADAVEVLVTQVYGKEST